MNRQFNPDLSIPERNKDIIRREIDEYHVDTEYRLTTLDAFRAAFREPEQVTVTFTNGTRQTCWAITRRTGAYRVVFLPRSGFFSLCAIGDAGLLDIGVHGSAIGCFSAV